MTKLGFLELDWKTVLAVAGVGWLAYEYFKGEAADAAEAVGAAVDPTSAENVFNRAAESLYSETTGDERTPGEALAEWLNPTGPECFTKVKLPSGEYRAAWHECGTGPDLSRFPAGTKEVG